MNKEFKFQPTLEECYELANKIYENGNEIVDDIIKEYGSSDVNLRSIRRRLEEDRLDPIIRIDAKRRYKEKEKIEEELQNKLKELQEMKLLFNESEDLIDSLAKYPPYMKAIEEVMFLAMLFNNKLEEDNEKRM